jgi:hypothetical protein
MNENHALKAKNNTKKVYLILGGVFVALFAGITLGALFVSKLNLVP